MAFIKPLYDRNFLEYASYVIKDRAIPHIADGLKPVQRRILHTLFEMDDGKFHKVANVVGHSMRYHPHGDASIYEALVVLACKDLFIDRQGNFGNIYTGDVASAARYIECRLMPLAREVFYNPEITQYEDSYDGRSREPVVFPAKIPVLLLLGTEGIAVGMATKILPHNFAEVIDAQIACLEGRKFKLYPDFPTGGILDVSEYGDGNGKVVSRARIDASDPKRIVVRELPAGLTTSALISSIEDAARKNKLKVAGISDFTTDKVEIEMRLPRGVHSDETIDALYAFTDCQVSISANLMAIRDGRPAVITATEAVRESAKRLEEILEAELKIEEGHLRDRLHAKTLEQIFIENRIYKKIEDKDRPETISKAVLDGLAAFQSKIRREVSAEDVEALLRIPIRRISLYDINRAQAEMAEIRSRLKEIKGHLEKLTAYAVGFLRGLLKKYGAAFPRRSELSSIEKVDVREAARRDLKLRYDPKSGYLGYEVGGETLFDVSHYDRVLVIRRNGVYSVMDAPEKVFIDKGMLYCGFVDKDRVFNILYKDPAKGFPYIKRCRIDKFILNRAYELIPEGASFVRLDAEGALGVHVEYKPKPRLKVKEEDFQVESFPVRGLRAGGLRLSGKECGGLRFLGKDPGKKDVEGDDPADSPENEGDAKAPAGQECRK